LGRPFEEYTKKLDKLRRSAPTNTMTTQAGGATRAEPQRTERPQADRPQRTERPERTERPDRPPRDGGSSNTRADDQLNAAGKSPMAAPRVGNAGPGARPGAVGKGRGDDDDDFAGTDVSSLLG
jgi:hypothetical protein